MSGSCITDSPCGDPTCYRGGVGDWNYQYKDGPCASPVCQWPWQIQIDGRWVTVRNQPPADPDPQGWVYRRLPARPHFTDTPAKPIIDAGKAARESHERPVPMHMPRL